MVVTRTDALYKRERVRNKTISVGDVSNSDVQFGLIKEYLENNHHVTDDVLLKIKNINESLNQQYLKKKYIEMLIGNLKSLSFQICLVMVIDNKVDFTKLNGIVGIFAPNVNGKSSC